MRKRSTPCRKGIVGGAEKIWQVERVELRGPKNLFRHELMGLEVQIIASPRFSEIGHKGIVINETRNTLTIKSTQKLVIEKKGRKFRFQVGESMVTVEGTALISRPEERLKTKTWRRR